MKKTVTILVIIMASFIHCQERPGWEPTFLGSTNQRHAAFTEVFQSEDESLAYEDRWTLYISTFDALQLGATDEVYYMASPGRHLQVVSDWQSDYINLYDSSAYWPNDINYMNRSVVGIEGIVQTSGFLVTTKKDGKLQLYDTTVDPPSILGNIAEGDSNEWAYHRVIWQDMDLDGDQDAVTCRFHFPNVGSIKTEFMWFENPGNGVTSAWTERVISDEGPDVNFATTVVPAGGIDYQVFIMAEFFAERVTLYWTDNENNDWSDDRSIQSRVINPAAGQTFDVLVDDLNRDGRTDILISEYDTANETGHATVYFFPDDFRTDDFESVIIADGFFPNDAAGGESMSPGSPSTFYPSKDYEQEIATDGLQHKPWILLSGDDDGKMYILYPETEDRDDWMYEKNVLIDTEDTTCGKMTHGDLDGDGYEEIIVAGYSAGRLYVFTYAP